MFYDFVKRLRVPYNWLDDEATAEVNAEREEAARAIDMQQARIDELMLEYCPEEITREQFESWKEAQKPIPISVARRFDEKVEEACQKIASGKLSLS